MEAFEQKINFFRRRKTKKTKKVTGKERNIRKEMGGSPCLVVMGGDLCSEGLRFESQHHRLDGHNFTLIWCKNCNDVCLKKTEMRLGWQI